MHRNAKHTISSWEVVSCNTRKVSIISLHHATTLPPRQGIKFIHFSIKWNEKNKRSKVKNKSHGLFVNQIKKREIELVMQYNLMYRATYLSPTLISQDFTGIGVGEIILIKNAFPRVFQFCRKITQMNTNRSSCTFVDWYRKPYFYK